MDAPKVGLGSGATFSLPSEHGVPTYSDEVGKAVASVEELDIHELRIRWRKLFRSSAPPHLPRYLLLRIIAYRIQANAYGDLIAKRPAISTASRRTTRSGVLISSRHAADITQAMRRGKS